MCLMNSGGESTIEREGERRRGEKAEQICSEKQIYFDQSRIAVQDEREKNTYVRPIEMCDRQKFQDDFVRYRNNEAVINRDLTEIVSCF